MDLNRQLYRSNVTSGKYMHNSIDTVLTEVGDNIKTTYGPFGSHGMIETPIGCEPTKDGLTLLSAMKFDGTIASIVHKSVLSVSRKQVDEVGDGSTSTVLLLVNMYKNLMLLQQDNKIPPTTLKNAMVKVVDTLKTELKQQAISIDNSNNKLYDTIYTSVDGDVELTEIIIKMLNELPSKEPLILLETSPTDEHSYKLTKGVEVDGTIIRPDIFFNGLSRQSYEDPYIVVVNGRVNLSPSLLFDLTDFTRKAGCDIIFLCTGISEDILNNCVTFHRTNPGMFNRIAFFQMRNTAINDEFLDICAALGAKPVEEDSFVKINDFEVLKNTIAYSSGIAAKVILSEHDARFTEPKRDAEQVECRIEDINKKIEELKADPSSHNLRISDLETRRAFLSNNYAKLYVGGVSPQRKSINYELAADAVPQAISARKHGIVKGCNTIIPKIIADIQTSNKYELTELEKQLMDAVKRSYIQLFAYIVENQLDDAELAMSTVTEHINKNGYEPLNVRDANDTHVIYNSADTDRSILENATDMAVLLATTKSFLTAKTEFDVVSKY